MSMRVSFRALALLAACGAAEAQEGVSTASVSGRVTDPSGAVVAGAQVVARQTDTNLTRSATTDQDGRFRFAYLRVGPYEIVARQPGFKEEARRLRLGVGAAFELPLVLSLAGVETSLTVSAESVLETARSQIAATVTQAEAAAVPLNGRQFLDLALLVPGVSPTNVGAGQLFPETSAVPGVGLSVSSQRNLSNNFIVDGLSGNDDAAGLSGLSYGVDALEQFQVVTSGGQAELGRALGGYVNVVTRSGTNALRGDAYGYFRDERLNARNALSGSKLPMTQQQYGASLGGPLARDKSFFFANVERRALDQSGLVTIAPANVAAINARLAAVGYPGAPIEGGVHPSPVRTTHALAKLDHQWRAKAQLGMRYSLYDVSSSNARGAGGLNATTASAGLDNTDQAVALSSVITLSPRTVNETRLQLAYGRLLAPPSDPIGPAVSIAGVASFGTLSSSPTARLNKLVQVVNNLSHQRGAHALRAGVDFLRNHDTITFPRARRGSYSFSSLANFLAGTYNTAGFTQTFGASAVSQANPNLGLFVQDEWKLGPRFTLNLGLRYDVQWLETIEADADNVSPRVGLVWSPRASRKTLLRGSAGLFYDRVPLRALANALLSADNTTDLGALRQVAVSLSPAQAGAPRFPNLLGSAVPSLTLVNFTTMDRRLQNAHSRQAGLELEQQLGERATVSLGYQYLRGVELILSVNQNVPSCAAAGENNGCRPNPAYANNSRYSSAARSHYHGLHVSFVQRPARWGAYRLSYAWSSSKNDVGEAFFSSPIDPFDIGKDWGRSDDDQRHRLVTSGSLDAPLGFQISGMLQYYSALPFNITSGVTTIQGTPGRPIVNGSFLPRNAGKGSDFLSASARLSRSFRAGTRVRVEALAEVFNLTNRRNVLARNTNFGAGAYPSNPSPGFGQVTAVADPRTLQLGLRVGF